ncbi:hypothetical protein N9924_00680 [bacterium]|nr:hypothetical protein [bacterium]
MSNNIVVTEYYRHKSRCYSYKIGSVLYPRGTKLSREQLQHMVSYLSNYNGFDLNDRAADKFVNRCLYTGTRYVFKA